MTQQITDLGGEMKTLRRSIISAIFLLASLPAFGALRGNSTVNSSTNCTGPCTIADTYAGANAIVTGDEIFIVTAWTNGNSTPGSVTDPSGFTTGSALSPALATLNIDTPANTFLHIAVKTAASGDAGFKTYSTVLNSGGYYSQMIVVLSGRSGAVNNQAATATSAEISAGPSVPASYSLTGLTSLSGDDVLVFIAAGLPLGGGGQTYTASITGYTNSLNSAAGGQYTPPLMFLDKLNNGAGAFGPLAASIYTSTTTTVALGGFVLAVPQAAGGSCTNAGYEPNPGIVAIPNGTSGTYLLCNIPSGTPDCSSVTYYQPQGGKCGTN